MCLRWMSGRMGKRGLVTNFIGSKDQACPREIRKGGEDTLSWQMSQTFAGQWLLVFRSCRSSSKINCRLARQEVPPLVYAKRSGKCHQDLHTLFSRKRSLRRPQRNTAVCVLRAYLARFCQWLSPKLVSMAALGDGQCLGNRSCTAHKMQAQTPAQPQGGWSRDPGHLMHLRCRAAVCHASMLPTQSEHQTT